MCNIDWGGKPVDPLVVNCIFNGNSATYGGALANMAEDPIVINCTLVQNSATEGKAVWNDYGAEPLLVNCILWNGGSEILDKPACATTISYSDVQGGWEGAGIENIDLDPAFRPAAPEHAEQITTEMRIPHAVRPGRKYREPCQG